MSKKLNIPTSLSDLRSAVAGLAGSLGVNDPARGLVEIAAGRDPRNIESPLVDMVRKISYRAFDGGDPYPTPDEWQWLSDHVLNSGLYKKARVTVEMSFQAYKELMKYLHPTQASKAATIDVGQARGEVEPLNEGEIEVFAKKYRELF